jgi:putative transposase
MAHHRVAIGSSGLVFHALNRGVRRLRLFDSQGDYAACLAVLAEAHQRIPVRLLAYCLMPNHFHLVVWPSEDGQLSKFMQWFTATHSKRWHNCQQTTGTGSVYQGRFKAIPVQGDGHFLTLCRYVERNALNAGLVTRAEDWPWSSLAQRLKNCNAVPLAAWPIPQPADWLGLVNDTDSVLETSQLRRSIARGRPFGERQWAEVTARTLRLPNDSRGRPRKKDLGGLFT